MWSRFQFSAFSFQQVKTRKLKTTRPSTCGFETSAAGTKMPDQPHTTPPRPKLPTPKFFQHMMPGRGVKLPPFQWRSTFKLEIRGRKSNDACPRPHAHGTGRMRHHRQPRPLDWLHVAIFPWLCCCALCLLRAASQFPSQRPASSCSTTKRVSSAVVRWLGTSGLPTASLCLLALRHCNAAADSGPWRGTSSAQQADRVTAERARGQGM